MKKTVLSLLFMMLAFVGFGQITTSAISGIVTNEKKEVLVGASIHATHLPTGTQYTATANKSGVYVLPAVRVGGTNTPAFSVTRTSGQTLTTATTTKIQGNIELLDSNSNYDNATNYRFTPTTSGFYQFNLCCQPSRTDSNVLEGLTISIYKNGSVALQNAFGIDASDQNVFGYSINGILEANGTTDYFEAYINFSVTTGTPSIGTANGTANFNFSGFKLIQ